MADLIVVYWRDIPAQVIVKKGRANAKRELSLRFTEAIDMAAMRSRAHEADAYIYWRIFSDLSATLRYGVFFPGEAFSGGREARHFLFSALTYSF